MDKSTVDWVAMVREASTSPLGIVALAVVVLLFITLGIGRFQAAQRLVVVLSIVLLTGLFGFLVLRGPAAPEGGTICLARNMTLSRTTTVSLPGTDVSVGLKGTQVGSAGPQPRGGEVVFEASGKEKRRFLAEGKVEEVLIAGRTYFAEVASVMENTISLTLCRTP